MTPAKKKFPNKSERNKDVTTLASQIFHDAEMITKRPEGMSTEEYRLLRKIQSNLLKRILK
jgi:hypothetical protein